MITIKIECPSCKGTGLYKGAAEKGGAAVVCRTCGGTGETTYSYNEFTGRRMRQDVTRVYQSVSNYIITDKNVFRIDGKEIRFSKYGCTYEEWLQGVVPEHIKDLYCPCMAYREKCNLDRCRDKHEWGDFIPDCRLYEDKLTCWELFDRKNAVQKESGGDGDD